MALFLPLLDLVSMACHIHEPANILVMSLMYMWCRKNNDAVLLMMLVVPIRPIYYFWLILFLQLQFYSPVSSFLSVLGGHSFYFFTEIYPKLPLFHL